MTNFHNKWRNFLNEDRIPGGLGDEVSPDDKRFDPAQLAKGIRVEMEHTNDPKIAAEIARDHLIEDPKYYDKLATIEEAQVLREIDEFEIKRLSDIMSNMTREGTLSFDELFEDSEYHMTRLMIPMGTPPPEWVQIKELVENAGWKIDLKEGVVTREKQVPNRHTVDTDVPEAEGTKTRVEKMKLGKWMAKAAAIYINYKKAKEAANEYWQKYKFYTNPENHLTSTLESLNDKTEKARKKVVEFMNDRARIDLVMQRGGMEPLINFWNKKSQFYRENPNGVNENNDYSIIITRHPVDVLRMSDFEDIQSCHSQGGEYYGCAVVEARGAGMVAYVVKSDEVAEFVDENYDDSENPIKSFLADDEVFEDGSRGIDGVTPVSRVRLRKLTHPIAGGELAELAVPELSMYGKRFPELFEAVAKWSVETQKESIDKIAATNGGKMPTELSDYTMHGGTYEDTNLGRIMNTMFSGKYGDVPPMDSEGFSGRANMDTDYGSEFQEDEEFERMQVHDAYEESCDSIELRYNSQMEYCSIEHEVNHDEEYPYVYYYGSTKVDFDDLGVEFIEDLPVDWSEAEELRDEIVKWGYEYGVKNIDLIESSREYEFTDQNEFQITFFTGDFEPTDDGYDSFAYEVQQFDSTFHEFLKGCVKALMELEYIEPVESLSYDFADSLKYFNVFRKDDRFEASIMQTEGIIIDISKIPMIHDFAMQAKQQDPEISDGDLGYKVKESFLRWSTKYDVFDQAMQHIIDKIEGYVENQMTLPGVPEKKRVNVKELTGIGFDFFVLHQHKDFDKLNLGVHFQFFHDSTKESIETTMRIMKAIEGQWDSIKTIFPEAIYKIWDKLHKEKPEPNSMEEAILGAAAYSKSIKESEPFQNAVKSSHAKKKKFYITTGGSKSTGVSGVKKPDTKRSKSPVPGFGGS